MAEVWDVIIVGGGSAGCVVAGRLARESELRVLVLEAGDPAEAHEETFRSDGYKDAFVNDALMWERYSTPQRGCNGRRIYMGSGRGMGGSGSVNGMVYTRGSKADYAAWNLADWTWDRVTEDFTGLEAMLRPHRKAPTEFMDACIGAAKRAGFRELEDLNGGDLSGVLGYEWMNFEGSDRRSSYVSLLKDAGRDGVKVITSATVDRVVFDAARTAVGVDYRRGLELARAKLAPGGEVVLCAGSLVTPLILQRSGIGDPHLLSRYGIGVVAAKREVGRNLQDHPNVTVFFRGAAEVDAFAPQVYGFHRADPDSALPPEESDTCYVMYPARSSFREGMIRMLPAMALPDSLRSKEGLVRLMRSSVKGAFATGGVQRFVDKMWGIVVILGKPFSRGSIRLGGKDPRTTASIDPGYFTDERDLRTMVRGVALARRIAGAAPLAPWRKLELIPGGWAGSDASVASFIRRNSMTTFHYAGTARMGDDDQAVVTPSLALRGVAGVRVADASVIPRVPVSALNAPSMLIGWRAASQIMAR